jgi:hypothetical protein
MIKLRAPFGAIAPDGPPINAAVGFRFRAKRPRPVFTKMWMAASALSVAIIAHER